MTRYVGRFAPSPTGPLHAGSLLAAVASWLDARAHGGQWLLRIEDIDTPRCASSHASRILHSLDALGLHWDGAVSYQSDRTALYDAVLDQLRDIQLVYPCGCSRKDLSHLPTDGDGERVYPGYCRSGIAAGRSARSTRYLAAADQIQFEDRVLGKQTQCPASQCGDFVVRRADGLYAYQLAVVVDDAEQGISHIVRGEDLLASTGRQILLQRALGYATPAYAHIPVLLGRDGHKLSKHRGAPEIPWQTQGIACLNWALQTLGQPTQLGTITEVLQAALEHWHIGELPHGAPIPSDRGMPEADHLAN